ncbi:FecR family protein [Parapedobacter koreensis]|uniref:FecR family protein n=1 Tax=Parapedobacter koreensis TaxID=332977 RepID=A0A1H7TAW1_9SPHI|nr:FecR family protein [Parapedobacter koreensis]SEL81675.1 FecR family protein [Parapedobacter koreensis]
MSYQESRINFLAKKWIAGKITEKEKLEFEAWYNAIDDAQPAVDFIAAKEALKRRILSKIEAGMQPPDRRPHLFSTPVFRIGIAAASIVAVLSFAGILRYRNNQIIPLEGKRSLAENEPIKQHDVLPGSDKAILILGNGRRMLLANEEAIISTEMGKNKIMTTHGKLIFESGKLPDSTSLKITYNTILTPSSAQFQVVLPDGSRVWLNAESSLKFPDRFIGKKRRVELSGEGYFEVAQDPSKPFEVITDGQKIEVLGTHFNINAYPNEQEIRTTLLEGKVRLIAGNNSVYMRPGQEGVSSTDPKTSNQIILRESDVKQTIAWKNGRFHFKDADIGTIMRSIARWYDVAINYPDGNSKKTFSGSIYRSATLQEALKILNYSGINATLKNSADSSKKGEIIVYPN